VTETEPDLALGDRVAEWYAEQLRRRATTSVELADGAWSLSTPEWPRSYAGNGILVRRDPGADALLAWGDERLGGAGLEHRYVMAFCDLSEGTRSGLAAAGFELEPEMFMARPTSLGLLHAPTAIRVEVLPADESRVLTERLWREVWNPSFDDETVRQLAGRADVSTRSGPLVTFVVRDPGSGEPVSRLDVAVMGHLAEIDAVVTFPDYRGHGHADALLAAGVAEIASRGCDLALLTAIPGDWPSRWYARRGFTKVGDSWMATRVAGTPARPAASSGPAA
jgi:GNAT superfamily N-acetyltransferase